MGKLCATCGKKISRLTRHKIVGKERFCRTCLIHHQIHSYLELFIGPAIEYSSSLDLNVSVCGVESELSWLNERGKPREIQTTAVEVWAQFLWGMMQISDLVDQFINNTELMKMNDNLKSAESVDEKYRYHKLFELYRQFYSRGFDRQLESLDIFSSLVQTVDGRALFLASPSLSNFVHIPENLMESYSRAEIITYLSNADLRQLLEGENTDYTTLYGILAKDISKNYSVRQLLHLIIDAAGIVKELNDIQRRFEMEQERKRLLSGDISHEKNLQTEQLNLANVTTGIEFEKYLQDIFSKLGYEVLPTKASGDKGADLVLERNNIKYVVQVKFYSTPVGNKAVQEVYSAKSIYNADKAAVITNNSFTKQALEDAASLNVRMVNGDRVKSLVEALAKGKFLDVFG